MPFAPNCSSAAASLLQTMLRLLAALALVPAVAIATAVYPPSPSDAPILQPYPPVGDTHDDVEDEYNAVVRVPTNSVVCAPFILPPNSRSSGHAGICIFLYSAAREQKPKWLSPLSKHS